MTLFLWRHTYGVCNTYKVQFSEVVELCSAPVAGSWVCMKFNINTIVFWACCWVEQRVNRVTTYHFHGGQPGSWRSYLPTAAKYTRVVCIKLNSCYAYFIFFCELHTNLMRRDEKRWLRTHFRGLILFLLPEKWCNNRTSHLTNIYGGKRYLSDNMKWGKKMTR